MRIWGSRNSRYSDRRKHFIYDWSTYVQKADKEKAALSELRFELKKHDEMMEIVEKGNQASEIAKKLKARESRQLLRT